MTEYNFKKRLEILDDSRINHAILEFFLGDHLGSGVSRAVFEYNLDPKFVVKIEKPDARGDNWAEWRVWEIVMSTEHKKWFAECTWISNCGRIMLQRKTTPLTSKTRPGQIPIYLFDVKQSNFGTIGKQVVCHDYTSCISSFATHGLSSRMKKFKCHDEQ
jgi:hypothetical protein